MTVTQIIDAALPSMLEREFVPAAEVLDLLLDLRNAAEEHVALV